MIDNLLGGQNDLINILGGVGFFATAAIVIYILWVYVSKIRSEKSEGKLADETWDGIGEYKNPVPTGWLAVIFILIVWGGWYWLIGYPPGSYSQLGQWNQENEEYKASFEDTWTNTDAETLTAMGESVYLAHCAQCHGLTADGLDGRAANLTKRIDAASVKYAIVNGSNNMGMGMAMPAMLVSGSDVDTVANYVANGFAGSGADIFATSCSSCHGSDGNGVAGLAPSLRAFNSDIVIAIAKNGKRGAIGTMPAMKKAGVLSDIQYKAVAQYIVSLGQ